MIKSKFKLLTFLFVITDVILLISSFLVSKYLILDTASPNLIYYNTFFFYWSAVWVIISLKFDLYEIPRILYIHKIISKNLYGVFTFSFISLALIFFVFEYKLSRLFFATLMLSFLTLLLLWRFFCFSMIKKYRKKGHNSSKIVLVGINKNILKLINKVYLNRNFGFKIEGLFTDAVIDKELKKYLKGKLKDIFEFLEHNKVDEIIISLPYHQSKLINDLFKFADNNVIRVRVIPEFSEYLSQRFSIDYIQNTPIMKLRSEPLQSLTNRVVKRSFDVFFSFLVVILIFSWLFPIIAIIIKSTSKGPVFFVQQRTGKNGEAFNCFKFRSMTVNKDSDNLQATKNDKRVTKFGAFMRKTSIDELPQIFNVLLNHMSLVGPRPHMLKHTEEYRVLVDKFMVRHFAKPGVTGWAQINGFRGETKYLKDMSNRAAADIWYIENWSFLLDIKIVIITAWSMFFKRDENAF